MKWTIRKKITSMMLLLSLASITFVGGQAYREARQSLVKSIGAGLERQSVGMIDQLDRMMFERYRNMQSWADEPVMLDVIKDDREKRISDFLTTMKKEYGFYTDLVLADNGGRVVASSNPVLIGKQVRQEFWFKKTLQSKTVVAHDFSNSALFGSYVTAFSAPVLTANLLKKIKPAAVGAQELPDLVNALAEWKTENLGVLAGFLNWSEVINWVNQVTILEGKEQDREAYAMLIDRAGRALTQPYFEDSAVMFHENLVEKGLKGAEEAARGGRGYLLEKGRFGKNAFIGYAASQGFLDFKGFGWSMLVFQSASAALQPIESLRWQILLVSIVLGTLTMIFSLLITGGITRPIEKLEGFTKALAGGDFSGSIEVNSKDEIGSLAGSFNDMIRHLKSARQDLTDAKEYTENILKSIGDALIVLNQEGVIQRCNPAVKMILGFDDGELIGRSIHKLLSDEHIKEIRLMQALVGGTLANREMEFQNKIQQQVSMLVSSTVIKDQKGKPIGVVVNAKDIRDYKSLELQFREAQKMDAVGKLASGIAHDFNNMLTVINGYSEKMLRKMTENDPRGGEVGQILKAGRRAARLVGQLLAFSRRQIVKPTIIDMNELIKGMLKMLKLITGEKIEIVTLPGDNLWPVRLDSGQFEQVLANLTVNARDAMPEGGKLVFETKNVTISEAFAQTRPGLKEGDYVLILVKDNGTGMTEEIKRRIFEPFFTTKPKGKGTGLGLATCYSVVKQAEGYIDVETAPGKGTAFLVYIPKTEGAAEDMADQDSQRVLPTGTETILVAEDEELVRQLVERLLMEQGYKVITAMDGFEAIRKAEEIMAAGEPLHMLLTDVVMPKMGGRELAERLQKILPKVRVIYMSGYIDDDTVQESAINESIAFIQKPITPAALALKVREVLDEKKL